MAEEYADIIRRTQDKPCILGGWSFGGVVAFEAARNLMKSGREIVGVVMIDPPPAIDHKPLSSEIIAAVTDAGEKSDGRRTSPLREAVREITKKGFTSSADMLGVFQSGRAPETGRPLPRIFLLRAAEGFKLLSGEVENPWLQDRSDPGTGVAEWEGLVKGKVSVISIPGNHFQVFDPPNVS